MAATVTERLWEIGDIVGVLEAWEAAQVERSSWEEGHGMVWPENIDSGYSNFQLDTRSSGPRRNLDYLSRCNVTVDCFLLRRCSRRSSHPIIRSSTQCTVEARCLSVSFARPQ